MRLQHYSKGHFQHDCMPLSFSTAFYDIVARAYTEIKISSFWTREWPTSSGFLVFYYFLFFIFFPFLSFKNFWESIIETSTFYHGVAKCSCRKFCSKFFTHISEHFHAYIRLHLADHSDLGIVGKILEFCMHRSRAF